LAFTLFAAALCGGLAWSCKDSYRRKTADIRDGRVTAADLRVRVFELRSRYGGRQYGLSFDGVDQIVSKAAYDAVIETIEYRVYRLPHSRRIVALEPKLLVERSLDDVTF
jgi:hypothetical protein